MSSSRAMIALNSLQKLSPREVLAHVRGLAPSVAKLLVCLLFLLNIRSWPLAWHFRVFRPVFARRFQHLWLRIRMILQSPATKLRMEEKWLDSIAPVGQNPLKMVVPYKTWASLDDSDFNGHLSNSSYCKILDSARFKAAVDMFPMFFPTGGWMALAGTHCYFVREIPMLSSYEIRTSIAAWDQKWIYVLSKFVRKSDGKKKRIASKPHSPPGSEPSREPIMALRTPGPEGISYNGTPFQISTPSGDESSAQDTESALKAVAAGLAGEEPDGATLHTVAISQVCFKIGRITVPPGLVLGVNGFTGSTGHSVVNPPPYYQDAKKVMTRRFGGSARKLKQFMVGGWREVPETERWWEQALGPDVEKQRVKNLVMIEGLRKGLEHARTL